DQKHEKQRKTKKRSRGDTLLRFLLLEGNAQIIETHFARHGLSKDFFESLGGLCRTITGSSRAIDLCAAIKVVSHCELGSGNGFGRGQGTHRHSFTIVVADIKQTEVL